MLDDNYTYDPNGNVSSIVDTSGLGGGTRQGITYDGLDRLTAASAPGQSWNAVMTYDPLDNLRTHMAGSRNWTYVYDATKNLLDVLNNTADGSLARDIDHDVRGNVTTNGTDHYLFDLANRMTEVTGKERYFYDGHGRRVEIENVVGGARSFPMYSLDGKLVADLDLRQPVDQVHEYYYLNGSQVARRYRQNVTGSAWTVRYVHTDSQGSGVVETRQDASFASATKYKPYGEPNVVKQGPGYTGHVTDAATGLSYMQQRYYDPQIGRFLSVDPVASSTVDGWNFARYNYAANNPFKFKDPDGRIIDTIADVGFLLYDGYLLATEGATAANVAAVGADALGLVVPGLTGGGMAVRAAAHADDLAKAAKVTAKELRASGKADFAASRAKALGENGGRCNHCNAADATVGDHAKSLKSFAGDVNSGTISKADAVKQAHAPENVVGSCVPCNSQKSAKELSATPGQGKFVPSNPSDKVREKL